jgi:hypothetical protein
VVQALQGQHLGRYGAHEMDWVANGEARQDASFSIGISMATVAGLRTLP